MCAELDDSWWVEWGVGHSPCCIATSRDSFLVVRVRATEHLGSTTTLVSVTIVSEAPAPRGADSIDVYLAGVALSAAIRRRAELAGILAAPVAAFWRGVGWTTDGLSAVLI